MSADTKPPKEKVLHTRVPESLEAQIKALADALRVPVSSLVRNILEDSVAVIGDATSGLDETLKNVTKNVRTLSARAKADHQELRRGWTEFQTLLAQSFRARNEKPEERHRDNPSRPRRTPEDRGGGADGRAQTQEGRERSRERPDFADVLGWQPLTLNAAARCAGCEANLTPGDEACLGVRDRPGPRVVLCPLCLEETTTKARSTAEI